MKLLKIILLLIFTQAYSQEAGIFFGNETGLEVSYGKKIYTRLSLSYYNLLNPKNKSVNSPKELPFEVSYNHGFVIANLFYYRTLWLDEKLYADVGAGVKYKTLYNYSRNYDGIVYTKEILSELGGTLALRFQYNFEKISPFLEFSLLHSFYDENLMFGSTPFKNVELLLKFGFSVKINSKAL